MSELDIKTERDIIVYKLAQRFLKGTKGKIKNPYALAQYVYARMKPETRQKWLSGEKSADIEKEIERHSKHKFKLTFFEF